MLLKGGANPWDLTVRQMVSVAKSWFLSFFEPAQWPEIEEKLRESHEKKPTTVFTPEGGVQVSKRAMDEMADLLAAASGPAPEQQEASAETP